MENDRLLILSSGQKTCLFVIFFSKKKKVGNLKERSDSVRHCKSRAQMMFSYSFLSPCLAPLFNSFYSIFIGDGG